MGSDTRKDENSTQPFIQIVMPDPTKKVLDSIPMRNKAIDTLKSKFKVSKLGMPYNPRYTDVRNPKIKDSIVSKVQKKKIQ